MKKTLPSWKFNSSPVEKLPYQKERIVFQPSFFRGGLLNCRGSVIQKSRLPASICFFLILSEGTLAELKEYIEDIEKWIEGFEN